MWWSARRCAAEWGQVVNPDGYGVWTATSGRRLPFLLEHDMGTERLARLAAKLDGYADLTAAAGHPTQILFTFPTPERERQRPPGPHLSRQPYALHSTRRHGRTEHPRGRSRPTRLAAAARLPAVRLGRRSRFRGHAGGQFAERTQPASHRPGCRRRRLVLFVAVIAGAAAGVIDTALGATTASTGQTGGDSATTAPANGPLRPVLVPAYLIPLFTGAADTSGCGLTPALLAAQSQVESGYQADAISSAGAVGIMQFLPSTWAGEGIDGDHDGRGLHPRPGRRHLLRRETRLPKPAQHRRRRHSG